MAEGHSENKLRNETIQKEGCIGGDQATTLSDYYNQKRSSVELNNRRYNLILRLKWQEIKHTLTNSAERPVADGFAMLMSLNERNSCP